MKQAILRPVSRAVAEAAMERLPEPGEPCLAGQYIDIVDGVMVVFRLVNTKDHRGGFHRWELMNGVVEEKKESD